MESYVTVVIACSVLALLIYTNSLDGDFAYDDSRAIKTNPDVLPSTPVTSIFLNDFWGTPLTHSGSHKSYRPLCVLSFRLNYFLTKFRPYSYHLFNVALHAAATGLFTTLACYIFASAFPALIAGLTFASHPIHTEAVSGVVGRADIGAAIFYLLSFFFYIKYIRWRDGLPHRILQPSMSIPVNSDTPVWPRGRASLNNGSVPSRPKLVCVLKKWLYLSLCVTCALCSMLTKEHGLTVLGVCCVYDTLVHRQIRPREVLLELIKKKNRSLVEGVGVLVLSLVIMLIFRLLLMGVKAPDFAPADNPAADCSSFVVRTFTFLYLPAFNMGLFLYPVTLSFDWSMEAIPLVTSFSDPRNVLSLTFYLCLGYLLHFLWTRLNGAGAPGCDRGVETGVKSYGLIELTSGTPAPSPQTPVDSLVLRADVSAEVALNKGKDRPRNGTSTLFLPRGGLISCFFPVPQPHPHRPLDITVIALMMLVIPFLPATNLFFYVGFVVAERILYIPSMGYCLLIAQGSSLLCARVHTRWLKRGIHVALVTLIILFSMRTYRRNEDWLTEERLYKSGLAINPPKAYGNLANILSSQGRKAESEMAYKKALSYRSNMADVHYNLGILYQEQKRYEEAVQSYKMAMQYRPRMAMAHLNLGLVLGLMGLKEEAMEVYRVCSNLDGSGLKDPRTHEATKISALFNLGRLFADEGLYDQAIEVYNEAVQKMPPHYQPQSLYNMLGEAFFKLDKLKEAEHWYREALRVKPDHVPAHLTYGKLLSKMNRVEEAEEWFLKARALAPNDSSIYQHYGQFLSELDRHKEAAGQYIKAAELAPQEYEIIFNAANTLRQAGRNELAEKYYRLATHLRPNEATSHMNLGAMLHVNGKFEEAEMSYLEALRLKPDDNITQANLQKLKHILNRKGIAR